MVDYLKFPSTARKRLRFACDVVTTNYDTVVEQGFNWGAVEQGFEEVCNEAVCRLSRHRSPPPRLMHLHGSTHLGYRASNTDPNRFIFEDEFEDLYWHHSPESALATWFGRSSQTSQAGRDTVIGPIITGLQKPDKFLVEPYLSYFRHFEDLAAATSRILLVGYGFGDAHINAALSRLTKWHGAQRRIVVIDYWREQDWNPLRSGSLSDKRFSITLQDGGNKETHWMSIHSQIPGNQTVQEQIAFECSSEDSTPQCNNTALQSSIFSCSSPQSALVL